MSILSDGQIKQRVRKYIYMVTCSLPNGESYSAPVYLDKDTLDGLIEGTIHYDFDKHPSILFEGQHYGITSYSPLTDAEQVRYAPMIQPFIEHSVNTNEKGEKIPSYGLGSYSYDVRIGRNFKMFKPRTGFALIDTASPEPTKDLMDDYNDVDYIDIAPGGFALGVTMEHIRVPRDILVTCMAKSSLARMGLMAHVTPIEPEWFGYITIELSNLSPYPIRVHSGIGIMALTFHTGEYPCDVSYFDRKGKYLDQPDTPVQAIL